jgi:hypothetical protein
MVELSTRKSDLLDGNPQPVREFMICAPGVGEIVGADHHQTRPFRRELAAERPLEAALVDLSLAEAHDHDEAQRGRVEVVDYEVATGAAGDRHDAAAVFDERQVRLIAEVVATGLVERDLTTSRVAPSESPSGWRAVSRSASRTFSRASPRFRPVLMVPGTAGMVVQPFSEPRRRR